MVICKVIVKILVKMTLLIQLLKQQAIKLRANGGIIPHILIIGTR